MQSPNMDDERTSSVYSKDDPSSRSTYLDYRPSVSSRAESSASTYETIETDSSSNNGNPYIGSRRPAPATYQPRLPSDSQARPGSRRVTPLPSFMNHQPRPSSIRSQPVDVPHPNGSNGAGDGRGINLNSPNGMLLVFVVGEPHHETKRYIAAMLKRHRYQGLSLLGTHDNEAVIKQLKMDMYGLLGQLDVQATVKTHLQPSWSADGLEHLVQEASTDIQDVLVSLGYSDAEDIGEDILSMDSEQVMQSYQRSVGALHAMAKAIIPHLLRQPTPQGTIPRMFLLLDKLGKSQASPIAKAACRKLFYQLDTTYACPTLEIKHAETALEMYDEPVATSGQTNGVDQHNRNDSAFMPSESPTKLYGAWLQHEAFLPA
ncbi:hypothetical protein LTR62_003080 [Meristemomyces frigidus]|uniref:Uncharacterized protein n=1 Tax=Meristemomyces frigidus TaxID=1508187 RepID=A0AAN7TJ46_9PEZI|nr:hypothetical protein LTR62_003080 [Meristemomyces frigidus]